MKKVLIIFIALFFLGFTACDNSGQKSNSTNDNTDQQEQEATSAESQDENSLPDVPADAKVSFKNLEDGQTVTSPFKVEMGVEGMEVEPAGEVHEGFGHHHILIDQGDSFEKGKVIPADSTHLHFGDGQTETELDLPAGEHQLTLQFADGLHRSYGKQLAKSITVNVE